jgi:hypothetical protein
MGPEHNEELRLPSLFIRLKVNSIIICVFFKKNPTQIFGLMMDSKHLHHIDLQSKHHLIILETFWDARFIGHDLLEIVMLIWYCHSKGLMLLNVLVVKEGQERFKSTI